MPDLKFLRTEQKNERIQHSNLDMSHKFQNTYNLGEIKVSQNEPILPSDSAELRVNDEIICQPLENPAFSKFKLCHKTFYMPYTNLWKYWDNFITEKPDFTWTSSQIQSYIESNQPYTPPYFTWNNILPIIAFARGYFKNAYLCCYPIMDNHASTPWRITNSIGNVAISDLCNMSYYEASSEDAQSTKRPRVLSNVNDFSAFDNNGDDITKVANTTYGSVFADNVYNRFDTSNNNVKKKTANVWVNITRGEINTCRWCLCFKITNLQHVNLEVLSNTVKDKDFSYLHVTTVNSGSLGDVSPYPNTDVSIVDMTSGDFTDGWWCLPLPAGFECSQYRMSMLAYLWYLCNNAIKLLDSMSIPVYTEELFQKTSNFDALPFFAYSRIYHEYFANKQIQVNAPDWSEANGPLVPEYSSHDSPSNHYFYGWILHHPEIPYNVSNFNFDEKLIIRNQYQGVCLLLGLNLNSLLFSSNLSSSFSYFDRTNKALSHTYMVYNGLLHLQYTNFPSDYFTEALLDPLAGAKDINIPSTITQLQERSKMQDFLNQTAWTRNIKEWLQSQWDSFSKFTTVNEPALCGSSDVDINISQVLQTSESAVTPLGTRAGVGSGYGNGYLCKQQFGEYGVLLTLSYIVLDTMYINRLDVRQRAKSNRFDYPLPQFANLGNEAIYKSELNFQTDRSETFGTHAYLSYISDVAQLAGFKNPSNSTPGEAPMVRYREINGQYVADGSEPQRVDPLSGSDIFGYIPRYSIYKHHMDEVHGNFLTTLKRWVPTRELNRHPTYLNYVFISYELASQTSNLLKNFVNTTSFGDDNFLVNHTNILHMRRALPYIVKPQLS